MAVNKRLIGAGATASSAITPSENFSIVTYSGTSATQSITGVGFKPDWVWIKRTDGVENNYVQDSSRGSTKQIYTNLNNAEFNETGAITSFDSDGFTMGSYNGINNSGEEYVAWCWKVNGGTTSSGSGTRISSVVNQVNTSNGISITTFTGANTTPTDDGNFTHGLGEVPDMFIVKTRNNSDSWFIYHKNLVDGTNPQDYAVRFTDAAEQDNVGFWNDTAPTSTTINVGSGILVNNWTYVCYAFKGISGFSKYDTYDGNGSSIGPIVQTGFEPAFVMVKSYSHSGSWLIFDNKRNTSNTRNKVLRADSSAAETTSSTIGMDFLSNGFQLTGTDTDFNGSGRAYIYMAFAADPDTEAPTLQSSFNAELYTGNGSTQNIEGLGFSPNLTWIKGRSGTLNHWFYDTVRGANNGLNSNSTAATNTTTGLLSAFDTDGFTLGSNGEVNQSTTNYIAWTWKTDDNEPTINTEGSSDSIVSVNSNAGFSIVKYVGNQTAGHTIGHGLSQKPNMIILKCLDSVNPWYVYHTGVDSSNPAHYNLRLQATDARQDSTTEFNDTEPTSTVFTLGTTTGTNKTDNEYIAYCFHDVTGYQKFGSYSGVASGNVTITTGFKPDFVVVKCVSHSSTHWEMHDSRRIYNPAGAYRLRANDNSGDASFNDTPIKFTSTGFYLDSSVTANSYVDYDANGRDYIYWAVAKNVPSNTTLADSFKIKTYTGNGSTQAITGIGFRPDLVWVKNRTVNDRYHSLHDRLRGPDASLFPNANNAQNIRDNNGYLTSFDSDGFSVTNGSLSAAQVNENSAGYVAWCWKAGNTWQSNHDGTLRSTVNVNTANGFSVVRYGGNGTNGASVGHGLSSTPNFWIIKQLSGTQVWLVGSDQLSAIDNYLILNQTNAETTNAPNIWSVDSTKITFNTSYAGTNNNGDEYVMYAFHSVSNFSKFGSYAGNGTTQTINVGFQPDFIMIKAYTNSSTYTSWTMIDSVRYGSSSDTNPIYANSTAPEGTRGNGSGDGDVLEISFTSTGFKLGDTGSDNASDEMNDANNDYIYVAFKMNPTPVVAAGEMAFLVLGGGGGGGSTTEHGGAGGGAGGGLRTSFGTVSGRGSSVETNITLSAVTYTITVGGAGGYSNNASSKGSSGSDSSIAASGMTTITSTGGGGGGSSSNSAGANGGSGGGGFSSTGSPGSGTAGQGFDASSNSNAEGSGGAGTGATNSNRNGGDGTANEITGTSITYGGGAGGGGSYSGSGAGGNGGAGGAGNGQSYTATSANSSGTVGTDGLGGGGGGGGGDARNGISMPGSSGGNGVVILRMRTSDYSGTTTGSPTVTTVGDETILKYTGSGTYVHS